MEWRIQADWARLKQTKTGLNDDSYRSERMALVRLEGL